MTRKRAFLAALALGLVAIGWSSGERFVTLLTDQTNIRGNKVFGDSLKLDPTGVARYCDLQANRGASTLACVAPAGAVYLNKQLGWDGTAAFVCLKGASASAAMAGDTTQQESAVDIGQATVTIGCYTAGDCLTLTACGGSSAYHVTVGTAPQTMMNVQGQLTFSPLTVNVLSERVGIMTAQPTVALDVTGAVAISGNLSVTGTGSKTTCTLNAASPSVCTATVMAGSTCTCSNVGATAAIAAGGCAVGLVSTTLTVTGANGAGNVVNIHCF